MILALLFAPLALALAAYGQLTVKAENKLNIARTSQTIELTAQDLASLGQSDLKRIHVTDASGKELITQAVDTDFDAYRKPDIVIFQSDFGPRETKSFTVTSGDEYVYTKEQFKAFGRFVRERFDDFAWENDRIAHRTYGSGLETWEGEPLSSSTIDIWSKRTPRMVINDWYLSDDYHRDHGEGGDLYSAGPTRGCGGNGLWAEDRLWTSRNFVDSRVLANGPVRVVFELVYNPFNVNGVSVSEVKRITLDAGQQLDHFESHYKQFSRPGREVELTSGIGLKQVSNEGEELNAEAGWFALWEKVARNSGEQGLAMIVDPNLLVKKTEDNLNHLMLVQVPENSVASYWAGFCWDRAGHITDFEAWKQYVDEFAQGLQSPIVVTVAGE